MLTLYPNRKKMLPFGSFAPGILLPILAFAYILYFGACALNKGVRGDENSQSDLSPEKTLILTEQSSVLSDTTCQLYPRKSAKPDAIWGSSDILSAHKQKYDTLMRQIMGVESGFGYEKYKFEYQNIIDNVSLLDDETVKQLNHVIVEFGHEVFKKKRGQHCT